MDPGLIVEKKLRPGSCIRKNEGKKILIRRLRSGSYIRKHMPNMDFTSLRSLIKAMVSRRPCFLVDLMN